jgi:4-hydroxybenzoate polyprenyltransferase
MLKNAYYIIASSRISISAISWFSTLIYVLIAGNLNVEIFLISSSIFFVTCAGFIFNDIYDYEKDKISKKNRPICSDKISKKNALIAATSISFISISIPFFFHNYNGFIVIGITVLGVVFYSPFSRKYSVCKGLYTSLLCCSPILFANVLSEKSIHFMAYGAIIFFITGREILLDIYDLKGDAKSGRKTIPFLIGIKKSKFISWSLMYISIPILIILAKTNLMIISFTLISCIALTICLFLPLKKEALVINITRLIMILSSFSLAYL